MIVIYISTTSKRTQGKGLLQKSYGKESDENVSTPFPSTATTLAHTNLKPNPPTNHFPSALFTALFYNLRHPRHLTHLTSPTVPELRIYKFFEKPIGPHPLAMFEVNLFTPTQFGAFIPWLVINRGPLSCLIHPNSVDGEGKYIDPERDHTQRATVSWLWFGSYAEMGWVVWRDEIGWWSSGRRIWSFLSYDTFSFLSGQVDFFKGYLWSDMLTYDITVDGGESAAGFKSIQKNEEGCGLAGSWTWTWLGVISFLYDGR